MFLSRTLAPISRVISRKVSESYGAVRFPYVARDMASIAPKGANGADGPESIEIITKDGQEFTQVQEGLGRILVPFSAKEDQKKTNKLVEEQQKVFYNPIQQFNRDLTVLAIKAFGQETMERKVASMNKRGFKRKRDDSASNAIKTQKQDATPGADENNETSPNSAPQDRPKYTEGGDVAMTDVQATEATSAGKQNKENNTEDSEAKKSQQPTSDAGNELANDTEKTTEPQKARQFQPPTFTILDALSATGLRAMRYAQELPFVTSVTANDLSPSAVEAIRRNAEHNGIDCKVVATQGDARSHMYSLIAEEIERQHDINPKNFRKPSRPTKKYDVIDLDPYGTAATFFDSAVHAVKDDGLLCITCTDAGVWASHGYPEKAFALYGGIPAKAFWSHEAGLRLVINGVASTAAKHGMAIEPLLSLSIDYYLRIFVRIKKSPAAVKFLAGKTMMVYNCDQGCGSFETQLLVRNRKTQDKSGKGAFYKHTLSTAPTQDKHCEHCGYKMHVAGPMYAGPLHSPDFIKKILDDLPNVSQETYGTVPRIEGMLQTALEEFLPPPEDALKLPAAKEDKLAALEHYPFYFHTTGLAGAMHSQCPDEDTIRGAIRHLGYAVTRSHCKPGSLKTNAPWKVIWHIMRTWAKDNNRVKLENITENSAAWRLLGLGKKAEPTKEDVAESAVDKMEVVFDKNLGRDQTRKGLVRYQRNPSENWGPQKMASSR